MMTFMAMNFVFLAAIGLRKSVPTSVSLLGFSLGMFMFFVFNSPFYNMMGVSLSYGMFFDWDSKMWGLFSLTVYIVLVMAVVSLSSSSYLYSGVVLSIYFIFFLVFSSSSIMFFYVCFEMTMIPVTVMIMGWGYQPERVKASYYLVIYTVSSSLPLLFLIIKWTQLHSINHFLELSSYFTELSQNWALNLRMSFFPLVLNLAFLVKAPMCMFHFWLPNAHVQAPVEGSMLLAGVMLKLGGFGMILISPLTFYSELFKWVIFLSVVGSGLFLCCLCIRETDIKVLIAISSVVHMSLMILGIYLQAFFAIYGMFIIMLAHGFCSPGLFLGAYYLYLRSHSRNLLMMSPASSYVQYFSLMWFLLCLANMSAPPTMNLVGELMCFMSISSLSSKYILFLGIMVFLVGAYTLVLYSSTQQGQNKFISQTALSLSFSELVNLTSLALPCFLGSLMTLVMFCD